MTAWRGFWNSSRAADDLRHQDAHVTSLLYIHATILCLYFGSSSDICIFILLKMQLTDDLVTHQSGHQTSPPPQTPNPHPHPHPHPPHPTPPPPPHPPTPTPTMNKWAVMFSWFFASTSYCNNSRIAGELRHRRSCDVTAMKSENMWTSIYTLTYALMLGLHRIATNLRPIYELKHSGFLALVSNH